MKTIRLYQNTPFAEGMKVDLNNDNSHHLNKVLRFPVGKNIIVFNGDGFDYEAVVESAKRITCINIISKNSNNTESKLDLTLAQGIAKGEKMDFLIQKAVELGVSRIIPMNLERCVVRLKSEKIQKKIEVGDIEIAPLAFMRGRTLKNSFAILDEAQNATDTQIKMFLTRIGENYKIVINGDPSQIDLPNKTLSGLNRSKKLLGHLKEISVVDFDHKDVVRHPLVSKIVKAYSDQSSKG